MWVEVQAISGLITVWIIYRHPKQLANDIESFFFKLQDIFSDLNFKKRTFYALEDFNFDFFKMTELSLFCVLPVKRKTKEKFSLASLAYHAR